MRRRTIRLLLTGTIFAVMLLTGCSGSISETVTSQSYELICETISETKQTTISVGDSATATLNAAISHKGGSLSIRIFNELDDVIYSGNDIAASNSFTLLLEGPAEYTLELNMTRFTGNCSFSWETVGALIPEEPEPIEDTTAQSEDSDDTTAAVSTDVVITNTSDTEPDHAEEAPAEETPEVFTPNWNSKYENADIGVTIEFFLMDSNFVEFQITGLGSVITSTAQIMEDAPESASYHYGDEIELVFRLTQSNLIITQTGTSSLLPESIAGEYLPSEPQSEP